MSVETAKRIAKQHGGTITGGLGLSTAAVLWMFATFAPKEAVEQQRKILDDIQKQVHEIHTQVVVLDAIRQNEQTKERKRYE